MSNVLHLTFKESFGISSKAKESVYDEILLEYEQSFIKNLGSLVRQGEQK